MYNEPQKLLYIESCLEMSRAKNKDARRDGMRRFFNRIQEPEVYLDKDFAMFNYEEIKMALATICRRSVGYQRSTVSELRRYVEWCIDNGLSLDCENRLIGLSVNDLDIIASYRASMFKNEAELNLALDKILMPLQADTSNNNIRAILHLLFNGVLYNEIFDIKSSQVDFEKSIIHLHDRDVKISLICSNILKYVMNMYEFFEAPKFNVNSIESKDNFSIGLNNKSGKARKYSIIKKGFVIENSRDNRTAMPMTYIPIISNAFAALKAANGNIISVTIGDVVTSGIFSRVFENEISSGKLDFTEYQRVASQGNNNRYYIDMTLRDVESQYYGWKKAFGLMD